MVFWYCRRCFLSRLSGIRVRGGVDGRKRAAPFCPQAAGTGHGLGPAAGKLRSSLGLAGLAELVIYHRYDIEGLPDDVYPIARDSVFSEVNQDELHEEVLPADGGLGFAVEYLPGQYDQRADSAAQCVQLLTHGVVPRIRVALHYQLQGTLSPAELAAVKRYCINPVDSREAAAEKPASLARPTPSARHPRRRGFHRNGCGRAAGLACRTRAAMGHEDLEFCGSILPKRVGNPP
jgi:phosphoribosylformylglycinamidine synthase